MAGLASKSSGSSERGEIGRPRAVRGATLGQVREYGDPWLWLGLRTETGAWVKQVKLG